MVVQASSEAAKTLRRRSLLRQETVRLRLSGPGSFGRRQQWASLAISQADQPREREFGIRVGGRASDGPPAQARGPDQRDEPSDQCSKDQVEDCGDPPVNGNRRLGVIELEHAVEWANKPTSHIVNRGDHT